MHSGTQARHSERPSVTDHNVVESEQTILVNDGPVTLVLDIE